MIKQEIIDQINKSLSEYHGLNEGIDDAAFYLEAASNIEAIAFAEWLNSPSARYAPIWDGKTWVGNHDEKTTEELYTLYLTSKEKQ